MRFRRCSNETEYCYRILLLPTVMEVEAAHRRLPVEVAIAHRPHREAVVAHPLLPVPRVLAPQLRVPQKVAVAAQVYIPREQPI